MANVNVEIDLKNVPEVQAALQEAADKIAELQTRNDKQAMALKEIAVLVGTSPNSEGHYSMNETMAIIKLFLKGGTE